MYTNEEILTIHCLIERMLIVYFADRAKPNDRAEIRQDILEKILSKKLRHNDAKGTLDSWLYRVIQNHLTDIYRLKSRNLMVPMESVTHFKESVFFDEEERYHEELLTDRWTQYNELLSREKSIDQLIVRMRHEQDLSYEQIAEKLAVPIGGLAMRYKRTKARLKANYHPNRILEK